MISILVHANLWHVPITKYIIKINFYNDEYCKNPGLIDRKRSEWIGKDLKRSSMKDWKRSDWDRIRSFFLEEDLDLDWIPYFGIGQFIDWNVEKSRLVVFFHEWNGWKYYPQFKFRVKILVLNNFFQMSLIINQE